ncbi:MAG: 16S rRNA (cytosine(1402)-N(4))-methyltransferase RsmH [Candidatus Cloacimonetes bacterium]|nr:16S rRNA (cytosine(1402)-N(4))-methyltransferase RsmH [Candidatus Cloacimonadota bacterium]
MSYHTSVLLDEAIQALQLKSGGIYVDGTAGSGGHSEAILKANPDIKLYAFDQDQEAIDYATRRLAPYKNRVVIIKDNFSNLRTRLALEKVASIDGILLDLGISSRHVDSGVRGFSFQEDYPLDMRMDQSKELTAEVVLNTYPLEDLVQIIRDYGEEKQAYKIAQEICERREVKPFKTTGDLSTLIDDIIKANPKFIIKTKARVFMALRIHINDELGALKQVLVDAVNILKPGGVIAIISFHGGEDKLIKEFFREEEKECVCPPSFPKCICNKVSRLKILTKKPIVPCEQEIRENSRSRSAKLRVAIKRRWGNDESS